MKISVLAVDLGFGSTKMAFKNPSGQLDYRKFTSAIGQLEGTSLIKDENAFSFDGKDYYMFDTALKMPSEKLLNLMSYEGLRDASPIILRHLMKKFDLEPELLVLGLSLTMMDYSADYKEYIARLLNISKDKIKLVPQGIGGKVAYDMYMLDPLANQSEAVTSRSTNYIGIDIGFNTVDFFQVINGQVYNGLVEGIAGAGISKVSNRLVEEIGKQGIIIDIQESKAIITEGVQIYRSNRIDRTDLVKTLVLEYIVDLLSTIETKYGATLNKMDNAFFLGGGAAILSKYAPLLEAEINHHFPVGYIMIPKLAEYYNVLGYFGIGEKQISQTQLATK